MSVGKWLGRRSGRRGGGGGRQARGMRSECTPVQIAGRLSPRGALSSLLANIDRFQSKYHCFTISTTI